MKTYVLMVLALGCAADTPGASDSAQASARSLAGSAADSPRAAGVEAGDSSSHVGQRNRRPVIVFVGTSLTAGYGLDPDSAFPQHIQRMIDSAGLRYDVVNAGVSGETSSSLLRRLDWMMREPFELIVVETGANDGLRGIPVETMEQNIQQIIDRIRVGRPDARIALVQMEAPPNLGISYTRRFRAVFPELARKNGIALLPFLLEDVAGVRELNQGDGIHPNYAGERILARNVWKGLRPMLQ